MTQTIETPRGIRSISDRAMLVGLHIAQFNPVKTDKKITEEVAQQHGSEVTMGRYAKSVIAKGAVDALRKLAGEIRKEHARRTLPWAEDGARILTSSGYTAYADFMHQSQGRWDAEVGKFLAQWDTFVDDARVKLNGLFNPDDYPNASAIRAKFSFRWTVRPVPAAEDFRVNLGNLEVSAIRAEIDATTQATIQNAMRDVWERMRDVVRNMADRLKAYDPEAPNAHPFRDSLVSNIAELLEVLPALNLTQDPALDRFMIEMGELTKHSAQELRDRAWARDDISGRAQAILDQMSQFVA